MKDFKKILGPVSYHEGNFYYELIENLKLYRKHIQQEFNIDKKLIKHLYHFTNLMIWTIKDVEEGKYEISGLNNKKELFDYYENIDIEIINLLS